MVYVIIAVAMLLIIAPIVAILPSKNQKAAMAMRRQAMDQGFMVEIKRIRDPQPDQEKYRGASGKQFDPIMDVVAYKTIRERPEDRRLHPRRDWTLLRDATGLPAKSQFIDHWFWEGDGRPAQPLVAFLKEQLGALPNDVVKVDESNYAVALYWQERGEQAALDKILGFLNGVKQVTDDSDQDLGE